VLQAKPRSKPRVLRDVEENSERISQPRDRYTGSHRRADQARETIDRVNDDEVAFYDALAVNNSALEVMGKDNLKVIATELVTRVRKSVTIDWTLRESARAKIKVLVKRILRKHGYPPDLQDEATKLVLQQAELLCAEWAA
jgi:type I site-specific restriction-modification system R (restriction) subunit